MRAGERAARSACCAHLWMCACGCCGVHHHYLGRDAQGLVWSLSCGLCGMGLVSDAFHLGAYTDEANSGSPVAPREGLDGGEQARLAGRA